jgi:hypothetical protein
MNKFLTSNVVSRIFSRTIRTRPSGITLKKKPNDSKDFEVSNSQPINTMNTISDNSSDWSWVQPEKNVGTNRDDSDVIPVITK